MDAFKKLLAEAMEHTDTAADLIEDLSLSGEGEIRDRELDELFGVCERLEMAARELYAAYGPAGKAQEETDRTDAEVFRVGFDFEDREHFTFIFPPLVNRRSKNRPGFPYRALREQMREIKESRGIERRPGRAVCFKHYITPDARACDYDNLEITGILNLLVDTCLADDSIQNYSLIHTRGYCGTPEEMRCEVSVFPEEEL